MTSKKRTALLIDLDETVLTNPFNTVVFPLVTAKLSNETGQPVETIYEMLLQENERRRKSLTDPILAFDWDDITKTIANRLGAEYNISIEHLVNEYASPPYTTILGEADRVLIEVRRPYRLIVAATNGLLKYQMPVLKALGLYHLFDDFLAPDITFSLKGQRNFYSSILDTAEIVISIGDAYEDDIALPKKLGMHTIWINKSLDFGFVNLSPFERVNKCCFKADENALPDAIVTSLIEIPSVVDKIELSMVRRAS